MKSVLLAKMRRRDMFRAAAGAAIAASGTTAFEATAAQPTGSADKRKARYRPNAPEVQNFYRVNRYPAR